MDKNVNKEIIFHKNQKKIYPQKSIREKNIISNFHKYTIDSDKTSNITNKNNNSKKKSKINSEELFRTVKKCSNTCKTNIKSTLRASYNKFSKTHNQKKIIIKIQRKKATEFIKEDNIDFNKASNSNRIKINKKIIDEKDFCPKNRNTKSKTYKKIEINVNEIRNMKNLNKAYNNKTFEIKKTNYKEAKSLMDKINIYISDITNRSLGDSPIEINKPRKSEKTNFRQFFERQSNMTQVYKSNYFEKLYDNESNKNIDKTEKKLNLPNYTSIENNNNYTTNRTIRKKDNNYKQSFVSLYNTNNIKDVENELDKFFNNNKNNNNINNNELFRFSNISFYNNNDLFYLNSKNKSSIIEENFSKNRNSSYFINPKIENIEPAEDNDNLDDFLNDSLEIILKQKAEKINDNIISVPCINCEKMININEIDEHSNKCYKINEEIKYNYSVKNYISIIDNKIKNLYFHISNIQKEKKYNQYDKIGFDEFFDLITTLNQKIEEILGTKLVNSLSINKLSKINNNLNELMEKYYNSTSLFTLLSRIKNLLEEKIKYFIENNENNLHISNNNNIDQEDQEINNKNISKTVDNSFKNKNKEFHIHNDNSIDDVMSESETMELFDLKKMEKILDKKSELNAVNLDNFVNETKNKRLFMMEILKIKYQKINNNKSEDLVPPEMIWEEAKRQKIGINEWPKFIFDELSNPNKYLKMIQKKKEKKKIKKHKI